MGLVEQRTFRITVRVSHDTFREADKASDYKFFDVLLPTLEGDAMAELHTLPRGDGLEWWRRPSQRHAPTTLGHCRTRPEQIWNPMIHGEVVDLFDTLGERGQGVRDSDHTEIR